MFLLRGFHIWINRIGRLTVSGGGGFFFATIGLVTLALSARCASAGFNQPAPPLQIGTWLKGQPVDLTASRTNGIRVLLFWETWCDSCMASLPEVVAMQDRLRPDGVEFIGIASEKAEVVSAFLTNSDIGPKLNFTIGCDPTRKTFDAYMTAYRQAKVPRAFVLDPKGKIVWCGHPQAGLETALQQLRAGKFNYASARRILHAEKSQADYFERAAANSAAAETAQLGRRIVSDGRDNPWLLNNFAWRILKDTALTNRDVKLAVKASKVACENTAWNRPAFLDTHATALFADGNAKEATRVEQRAIQSCTNEPLRVRLEQALKSFQTDPAKPAAQ